ncbi:MAG TPA: tetratricopeptide repeat protein [Gemmatimonadaceae bacterium]|nr:tetratricopeptide repeat protein [Gemmatimonadaceae bacterium]
MRHHRRLDAAAQLEDPVSGLPAPQQGGASQRRRQTWEWALPALIAVATFIAFLPALRADFVDWDDESNFLANPYYRGLGPAQLRWMWSTTLMGHYIPVSWMTLGLDYTLWGMNPAGYHLTNLVLHCANAVLFYFLARRLLNAANLAGQNADQRSVAVAAAIAALLFAIHPLRVESVGWVTERRDMLSMLFYLSALILYLRYVEQSAHRLRPYLLALGTFVLSLLSKGTAITLAPLLLILNVYPLRRLGGKAGWWTASARRVYLEVLPIALLSAAISLLSIIALKPGRQLPFTGKLAVSAYSLAFYLWKTIAPSGLAPLYDMPKQVNPLEPRFIASYAVVAVLIALVLAVRRPWPGVAAAALAYFVILFPLLGVVQNGPQIAADRYTYHASPALALVIGSVLLRLKRPLAPPVLAFASALIVAFGVLTWRQTRFWNNTEVLWTRVLEVDETSPVGNFAMGAIRFKQDRVAEAIQHYSTALAVDSLYGEGHNNLGVALARQRRFPEAIREYQRAIALKPSLADAHNNLGTALAAVGDLNGAITQYSTALSFDPGRTDAEINWGNALVRLDSARQALPHYARAVQLRPTSADAHHNWGVALARLGDLPAAIEQFRATLAIQPDHAEAARYLEIATRMLAQKPNH